MTRAMLIIQSILAMFAPAHRLPTRTIEEVAPPAAGITVNRMRDAEELEHAAREQSNHSTCKLVAIAQRVKLGRKREQLNGHGERNSGAG